jgi:hypothetical protein
MRLIQTLCVLVLVAAGLSPGGEPTYRATTVARGGVVTGSVRLSGPRPMREELPVTKDPKVCGVAKVSPRLRAGASGGVADAIVYLDGIAEGKPMPAPGTCTLRQRNCSYTPHVLLTTLGSQLEIVNDDPVLHNVHAYTGDAEARSVFNIAQPVRGQRTVVKSTQLARPGMLAATCDAGHPWMGATIAIAPHPYYALTDTSGAFRFDAVPPGTYTLVVWHEGVRLLRKENDGTSVKRYVYEDPYELRRQVVVSPDGEARVDLPLILR